MLNLYVLADASKSAWCSNFRKVRRCDLVIDFLKKNFRFWWFSKKRLYVVYPYGQIFIANKNLAAYERAGDDIDFLNCICTNKLFI